MADPQVRRRRVDGLVVWWKVSRKSLSFDKPSQAGIDMEPFGLVTAIIDSAPTLTFGTETLTIAVICIRWYALTMRRYTTTCVGPFGIPALEWHVRRSGDEKGVTLFLRDGRRTRSLISWYCLRTPSPFFTISGRALISNALSLSRNI